MDLVVVTGSPLFSWRSRSRDRGPCPPCPRPSPHDRSTPHLDLDRSALRREEEGGGFSSCGGRGARAPFPPFVLPPFDAPIDLDRAHRKGGAGIAQGALVAPMWRGLAAWQQRSGQHVSGTTAASRTKAASGSRRCSCARSNSFGRATLDPFWMGRGQQQASLPYSCREPAHVVWGLYACCCWRLEGP
jgi:hypothetical protein